jgi:membrane associated rhomboid family serine protease
MLRAPDRRQARVVPAHPFNAAILMCLFVGVLYAVEAADQAMNGGLEQYGIEPRQLTGLEGILFAPLLHAGWPHLFANTVPLLVLGWLAMSGGLAQFAGVTAIVWVVSGVGTWLFGSGPTVGASGIAFGWMVFLLIRGLFLWSLRQIFVGLVLFFYWGGMLLGVLPGAPGISWQGHLFGALGGLLAAWLVARRQRGHRAPRWSETLPR